LGTTGGETGNAQSQSGEDLKNPVSDGWQRLRGRGGVFKGTEIDRGTRQLIKVVYINRRAFRTKEADLVAEKKKGLGKKEADFGFQTRKSSKTIITK